MVDPSFVYESVGFNFNGIVSLNEEVTFINTATADPFYLEWDFGDGSPVDDSAQPTHSYQVTGLFDVTLRFYNEQGCFKEFILTIEVGGKYSVIFPDIFTPNNDGINDFFQGEFAGITNFSMESDGTLEDGITKNINVVIFVPKETHNVIYGAPYAITIGPGTGRVRITRWTSGAWATK